MITDPTAVSAVNAAKTAREAANEMLPLVRSVVTLTGNQKLAKGVAGFDLALSLYDKVSSIYDTWKKSRTFDLTISSGDNTYAGMIVWLSQHIEDGDQRSMKVVTGVEFDHDNLDDDGEPGLKNVVHYRFDGRRTIRTTIEGHPVEVSLERDEPKYIFGDRFGSDSSKPESRIIITVESPSGRDAAKRMIESFLPKARSLKRDPRIFMADGYGDWRSGGQIAPRDPSTVYLKDGQMERLTADLTKFFGSKEKYAKFGAPWHRGYLLYGPPGTGKTSTALALASALKLDIYVLSLTTVKSDEQLQSLCNEVYKGILLIEDVDIAKKATGSREKQEEEESKVQTIVIKQENSSSLGDGVTLNGLLNVLDGVATPKGLVTIMSTNHVEDLDPALVRKGRCDLREKIDYMDDDQISRMAEGMLGRTGPLPSVGDRQITASEIAECVKANIDDEDAAYQAIIDYLKDQSSQVELAA